MACHSSRNTNQFARYARMLLSLPRQRQPNHRKVSLTGVNIRAPTYTIFKSPLHSGSFCTQPKSIDVLPSSFFSQNSLQVAFKSNVTHFKLYLKFKWLSKPSKSLASHQFL